MVASAFSRVSLQALARSTAPSSSLASSSRITAAALRSSPFTHRSLHAVSSTTQVISTPTLSSTIAISSRSGSPKQTRKERRTALKEQRKTAKRRIAESTVSARLGVSTTTTSPFVRKDRQFKTFKPITRSIRWLRQPLNEHLHKGKPERSLTIAKRGTAGRNHHGHVTVRGRGGGHRRRIRLVDFYRWEAGEQQVLRIEYDPGRSAHIALIEHKHTKAKSYILAPDGLRAGDTVQSYRLGIQADASANSNVVDEVVSADGTVLDTDPSAPQTVAASSSPSSSYSPTLDDASSASSSSLDLGIFRTQAIRPGNFLPLNLIPIGTTIHSITMNPIGPAKMVRSAGTFGQLVAFSSRNGAGESHAQVRLQSGEVRLIPSNCCAAIGTVSNKDHQHKRLGKAGRSRWLGRRPKVRGVAMNACDHPHGGGRGKSKSNMHPRSIYGHLTKGARTRKPGTKGGNQMVVRERPRRNGKRLGKP
ncbi:probable RML2 - mitochondrial ribosomal protein, large subunit [Melanopsichium pennsylvanicum]|uniref:Large ribosomal subunit protein uL2m n=2 Tax=Melanopsichium pennsylvanicum TaxID=63383 RepID=A0AAJ4XTT3_9BASI|nr:probable RML2-mitochondrial ribosomal protein, large subunit [Melanopsichium pennsylvanicum 4]SNX87128.1 probable RML2 - mitochondrial ribosomal protein, large subunit [Melanopsichium pennsylvanicum]